MTSILNPEF